MAVDMQVPTETQDAIIKDVLIICQGVQGRLLRRRGNDSSEFEFTPAAAAALPRGMQSTILLMCELGWLYKCARPPSHLLNSRL